MKANTPGAFSPPTDGESNKPMQITKGGTSYARALAEPRIIASTSMSVNDFIPKGSRVCSTKIKQSSINLKTSGKHRIIKSTTVSKLIQSKLKVLPTQAKFNKLRLIIINKTLFNMKGG